MPAESFSTRRKHLEWTVTALGAMSLLSGCITRAERYTPTPETTLTPSPTPKRMPPFDASEGLQFRDVEPFEKNIHNMINKERVGHDRDRLDWRENLAYVARLHSRDMSQRGYFAHENPEGQNVMERAHEYNVLYPAYGENLHKRGYHAKDTFITLSEATVESWMSSNEGHRENLLNPNWDIEGIGVYLSREKMYVTQIFVVDN